MARFVSGSKLALTAESQGWRCCYCSIILVFGVDHGHDEATLDHLMPLGDGGKRVRENEVAACRLCNNARDRHDALAYYELVILHGRNGAAEIAKTFAKKAPQKPRAPKSRTGTSSKRWPPDALGYEVAAERAATRFLSRNHVFVLIDPKQNRHPVLDRPEPKQSTPEVWKERRHSAEARARRRAEKRAALGCGPD